MISPEMVARIAHPILAALGRAFPELAPLAAALNEEIERLFPELAVGAGPEDPPTHG